MRCACARRSTWCWSGCDACCWPSPTQIERWADAPTMAFTHLQPAEPTTMGYRLAQYAQDLLADWQELSRVRAELRGKGFKGAVGTSASYGAAASRAPASRPTQTGRTRVMAALGLEAVPGRHPDLPAQAGLPCAVGAGRAGRDRCTSSPSTCACCSRRPSASGPSRSAAQQVGSSAMPFKRNPINAEKIDSLARLLAALPRVAWDNAAHSLLERTLDDSANRRTHPARGVPDLPTSCCARGRG